MPPVGFRLAVIFPRSDGGARGARSAGGACILPTRRRGAFPAPLPTGAATCAAAAAQREKGDSATRPSGPRHIPLSSRGAARCHATTLFRSPARRRAPENIRAETWREAAASKPAAPAAARSAHVLRTRRSHAKATWAFRPCKGASSATWASALSPATGRRAPVLTCLGNNMFAGHGTRARDLTCGRRRQAPRAMRQVPRRPRQKRLTLRRGAPAERVGQRGCLFGCGIVFVGGEAPAPRAHGGWNFASST